MFYLLNSQGYGFLNQSNPLSTTYIPEEYYNGRFESNIFTIKLYDSNDDKEYLISIGKAVQYVEIYDFYNNITYVNSVTKLFDIGENGEIFTIIGVHLKLKSAEKEKKNTYLIGLLVKENDNSYCYLNKVNFTSLDIKNNHPQYQTQKFLTSDAVIISCYETSNYFIICFYKNPSNQIFMIVYDFKLDKKLELFIQVGTSNKDLFFKCIHFVDETGVLGYFHDENNSEFIIEFKRYFNNNNTITDHFTFHQLPLTYSDSLNKKATLCNMIKVEDKKFYFVHFSYNKDILFITSIFNYNEEKLAIKMYKILINKLYYYQVYDCLGLALYNNFLALASSHLKNPEDNNSDKDYNPFLIIFNYVKTMNNTFDLKNHIYVNNEKIYNITLELSGNYLIENNIFGYIYTGIQIIKNCIKLDDNDLDIYLADLNKKEIKYNYFIPKNEKIKLIVPKKDIYEPFFCEFIYAAVVTEPDYSEYNKYPFNLFDTGETNKEDEYFEINKKKYVGRYSYYKLFSNYKLTKKECADNCELCLDENNTGSNECVVCKYSFHFDNNIKICENSKNLNEINEITNSIVEVCDFDEIINNQCNKQVTNNQIKEVYSYIKSNLIKNNNNTLIKTNNVIFQISKIEEQTNLDEKEVSNVDLGECELRLKNKYNLSESQDLIIFKIDIKNIEQHTTYVQYEIYHPDDTKNKLNLDICEDLNINIYAPVDLDDETLSVFSSLEKSGYNLFNSNDSFYNDFCTPYTSVNGTDVILKDRQKDIYSKNGNKTLCQNDCELLYFNETNQKANCYCAVQTNISNIDLLSFITNEKDILEDTFINTLSNSNFQVLKCLKLALDFSSIFNNIGRIIMTTFLFIILILFIIYCILGNRKLGNYIKQILKAKIYTNNKIKDSMMMKSHKDLISHVNFEHKNSSNNFHKISSNNLIRNRKCNSFHIKRAIQNKKSSNNLQQNKIFVTEYNRFEKKNHKKEKNTVTIFDINDDKRKNTSTVKITKKSSRKLKTNNEFEQTIVKKRTQKKGKTVRFAMPPKKVIKTSTDARNNTNPSLDKSGTEQKIIFPNNAFLKMNQIKRNKYKHKTFNLGIEKSKNLLISKRIRNNTTVKQIKPIDKPNKNIKINIINFTNQELNTMKYKDALIYDKRTYLECYWSLLKKNQLILFTLINNDDYNLITIKFTLFFISFSLFFTLNGFFFSDSTMHIIYLSNGACNYLTQIPIILYSTMVTTVINSILKALSLSESNMLELKHEKNTKIAQVRATQILYKIKMKLLIFFLLSFLLMIFFWYYISCFCAVYKNTQMILIHDTLLSFGLSMLYPFGFNLLPGILRIISLSSDKKDKKCLYKLSVLISLI